jgi:hypothetical protein
MSEQPAPYNAANPAHVKTRKQKEERDQLKNQAALAYVMRDPLGRHFVWTLIGATGLYVEDPMTGNSFTFHNLGRASVGRTLQKKIEEEMPDEFILMWQEHLKEKENARKQDEAARINGTVKE